MTQPFPSRPPAYHQHGVTVDDDLIDFTPGQRAEAVKIINQYRYGPRFTPPAGPGVVTARRARFSAGTVVRAWTGAGVDPDTGFGMYPRSWSRGARTRLAPNGENDSRLRRVAIDLNQGAIVWTAVNGDGPHGAIIGAEGLNLPHSVNRAAPLRR